MDNMSNTQRDFLLAQKNHERFVRFSRIMIFVVFIGLWKITTRLKIIDSFIFSSPSRIVSCFFTMMQDGSLFLHIGVTLLETIVSFVLVLFIGIGFSILLWMSRKLSEILEPYLVILNSLPKSALAPVLIVWLGANTKTIIVCGMSVAIFGTFISLHTSFMSVDKEKIKLIQTLGGRKKDILLKVVIPSSIPAIISNMKVNIGLCLVGVIIGEFLAARNGLGYLIIYGSQVFKLDYVMMSIVLLCIFAIVFYKLINMLENYYLKKL